MSKTKLVLGIVQDLRSLADGLQDLCNALATTEPNNTQPTNNDPAVFSEAPTAPSTLAASSEAPTSDQPPSLAPNERIDPETGEIIRLELTELRALAASKAKTKEQKAAMRALLAKHGAEKLTDLAPEHY